MVENLIHQIPNTLPGNLLLAVVIGLSIYLLSKGADIVVEAAVEAARDLGVSQLVIGATIVSLGTTSPEAAVSVLAALRGNPGLALGNGVGSIICDQCLILGLAMTLTPLPIRRRLLFRQSLIVLGSALLLAGFAYGSPAQTITRGMGFVLVGGLFLYLYLSYRWTRESRASMGKMPMPPHESMGKMPMPPQESTGKMPMPPEGTTGKMPVPPPGEEERRPLWLALGALAIGLVILVFGSHVLIPAVSLAAGRLGVSDAVIAATIVAFGTSLPELMTAITAVRKRHPELVLGNVLGADALNVLFVIGVSASAAPLKTEATFYQLQAPFMVGALVLFQVFLFSTRDHFRRWQGLVYLGCYLSFVILQYAL